VHAKVRRFYAALPAKRLHRLDHTHQTQEKRLNQIPEESEKGGGVYENSLATKTQSMIAAKKGDRHLKNAGHRLSTH
jgi:hypothetical protein